jgi:hypothetical protein
MQLDLALGDFSREEKLQERSRGNASPTADLVRVEHRSLESMYPIHLQHTRRTVSGKKLRSVKQVACEIDGALPRL